MFIIALLSPIESINSASNEQAPRRSIARCPSLAISIVWAELKNRGEAAPPNERPSQIWRHANSCGFRDPREMKSKSSKLAGGANRDIMVFLLESEAGIMIKRLRDGQSAAGCNFEKF
jgi:hypothetical protein